MTGSIPRRNGPAAEENRARADRVLVIHRGALGDVLMSLPFLAALPGHFSMDGLTLVGHPAPLGLLANQPFVRAVRDQDEAGWAGLYASPPEPAEPHRGLILAHGAAVVLSRTGDDPAAQGLRRLGLPVLTAPSRPPAGRRAHLLDHMFEATGVRPVDDFVRIDPGREGSKAAAARVERMGLAGRDWVTCHPGSGNVKKNWPLKSWSVLADTIESRLGSAVVFLGGPADRDTVGRLREIRPHSVTALNLPLPELAGLLSQSLAHVGHDSGVTHLAAGLGCRTTAIFGPTDPALWGPRGPRVRIVGGAEHPAEWSGKWPDPAEVAVALTDWIGH